MQSRTAASSRAFPRFAFSTLILAGAIWAATPARAAQEPPSVPANVTAVVGGLDHPWALAFLPDGGGVLITERPGNLRLLRTPGGLSKPLAGVPNVAARGQGGLLDVALSPDFAKDRYVYLSYAESDGDKSGTAVGRGRLSDDATALEDFKVLFRQAPKLSSGLHFGSRLVFDGKGHLFISLGENNQ
ncbi:MAG TPA: oxidoreductase, partial [Achromobacter sp.]|nr:oxidoreductase [Achromobacter sp.]